MNDTTDATALLAPIWRRKWFILIIALLVAGGSYEYYKHAKKTYQSTTQLYLLAGTEEQQAEKGARRNSLNGAAQAQLITSVVHETVKRNLHREHNSVAKVASKGKVRAKAAEKSSFITITTEARTGKASALLANTLARTYIARQHNQYVRGLQRTIRIARHQLKRIETPHQLGKGKNAVTSGLSAGNELQAANLSSKINALESQLAVKAVEQIRPAKPAGAVLVSSKPRKNAEFGFVIGLILASLAAFMLDRFNRRMRSVADLESALRASVLTVIPQVKRPIVERDGAPAPARGLLESIRKLDATLKLPAALADGHTAVPKTVLFLSAETGEGTSSVVAALALAQRESGANAAIVEANLRHPVQARLLHLEGTKGLIDALAGTVPVSAVNQSVAAAQAKPADTDAEGDGAGVATAVAQEHGSLSVLVGTAGAANPQALLAGQAMDTVMTAVADGRESVLIDAPSPVELSDVIPLLPVVDGIVLVARLGHARDGSVKRLRQLLDRTPSAPVLGVVANGAARKEVEKYGVAGGRRRRLFGK
jgi:capsular polysaccharide biosynthesis protein